MVTVVFVFSANGPLGIAPFVEGLGEQLESMDVRILYFGIKGNGWKSYLKEALRLKKYLRSVQCDIIHGHNINIIRLKKEVYNQKAVHYHKCSRYAPICP